MRPFLPNINSRSISPVKLFKSKSKRITSFKSSLNTTPNLVSLTPTRKSINTKEILDLIDPRAASDEVHSIPLEKDSLYIKLTSSFAKSPSHSKSPVMKHKQKVFDNPTNFGEVINALFSLFKREGSKLSALSLIKLFVSLEFSENSEQIADIFYNLCEGLPLNLIKFSKEDLLKICKDDKADDIMRVLMRNCSSFSGKHTKLSCLLRTIKKWWSKLDKTGNGMVEFSQVIRFYADMGIVENTYDIKRVFLKLNQFASFKEFSSIFAKTLLRFLIQEVGTVIHQGSLNFLPADIAISTQRRKIILKGIEGQNKVLDALANCPSYIRY